MSFAHKVKLGGYKLGRLYCANFTSELKSTVMYLKINQISLIFRNPIILHLLVWTSTTSDTGVKLSLSHPRSRPFVCKSTTVLYILFNEAYCSLAQNQIKRNFIEGDYVMSVLKVSREETAYLDGMNKNQHSEC